MKTIIHIKVGEKHLKREINLTLSEITERLKDSPYGESPVYLPTEIGMVYIKPSAIVFIESV